MIIQKKKNDLLTKPKKKTPKLKIGEKKKKKKNDLLTKMNIVKIR